MKNLKSLLLLVLTLSLVTAASASAKDYYVSTDGVDAEERDGRTKNTAWASLAYACDRVEAGDHAIHILPGEYVATRTAYPKNGVAIVGRKPHGKDVTRIIASKEWDLPELQDYEDDKGRSEYLIAAVAGQPSGEWVPPRDLTINSLQLCSDPAHRITGAVYIRDGTNVVLKHLNVHDFRWNGLRVEHSENVLIEHCRVKNSSTQRLPNREGGLIRTRWIKHSRLHHNRLIARDTTGYGYKGGGHRDVRFDHNFVDTEYFAFESPFEHELGVEIDHNYLTRCISIPKYYQKAPSEEGYDYSVRIHHNYLTDSYTIEGPRGYLQFDHNWVHVEKTGGRIYTHHGAKSRGPIRIHHNVVENVDRNFVWMNKGLVENLFVFNNTIFCADAGKRSGTLLSSWTAERLNNWVCKNNIVVSAWSQPRRVHGTRRGVPEKITAKSNLFINFIDVPEGNFTGADPGLTREGEKPAPFYLPESAESVVVDRGVDVGLPFEGKAPDLGAFEFGGEPWKLEGIPQP